jgi:proline iminopeptidase
MTPDKYTINQTSLAVGDGHSLFIHDWGNKSASKPIICLHGGPGSSTRDKFKAMFNPKNQRVIFFDQRGCGKSIPYGELRNNTTDKLIEDINTIADSLKIKKFIIAGGSWGSCLALAYAIKYPKRVLGLVLNGIFTASKREIDWINKGDFKLFFPDVWQTYLDSTPKKFQDNPTEYHTKQVVSGSADEAKASAYAYDCLESAVMSLDDRYTPDDFSTYDPTDSIIEVTYLANGCYMPERHILQNAHKITAPVWLVQGRYDNVCPPITAYELNKELPNSKLIWVISGHDFNHEKASVLSAVIEEVATSK